MQGERRVMNLWVVNMGSRPVKEIWMVPDPGDEIWVGDAVVEDENEKAEAEGDESENEKDGEGPEVVKSSNSLLPPQPLKIPIPGSALGPEDGFSVPLTLHMEALGEKQFCLFFVYREVCTPFVTLI